MTAETVNQCYNHSNKEAVTTCQICNKYICSRCVSLVEGGTRHCNSDSCKQKAKQEQNFLAWSLKKEEKNKLNNENSGIFWGALVGGFLGFLLRPSTIVGQLPFEVVMSRGSNIKGLDQLLISTAQTSFNYMLVGAIIGAVVGYVTRNTIRKK